jgi:hypothetical protein
MKLFPCGHATHPQWPMAAGLVLAQLRAQMALPDYASAPTLGLLYITDHYAAVARDILEHLSAELPEVTDWAGTVGVGIAASNVEYFDEPALAVMLCELPPDQYRVFSGVAPLGTGPGMGFEPHTALLHADANTPDVGELIAELAERTTTGYLFGGLASSRQRRCSLRWAATATSRARARPVACSAAACRAWRLAKGVAPGVARDAGLPARGAGAPDHGGRRQRDPGAGRTNPRWTCCCAIWPSRWSSPSRPCRRLRATLVGLNAAGQRCRGPHRQLWCRHAGAPHHRAGPGPARRGHCRPACRARHAHGLLQRNVQAARADLTRICAEIREELEPEEMAAGGSGTGRTGAAGPAPPGPAHRRCRLCQLRRAGWPALWRPQRRDADRASGPGRRARWWAFAGGEIARHHLYGYTGVLTVFTD